MPGAFARTSSDSDLAQPGAFSGMPAWGSAEVSSWEPTAAQAEAGTRDTALSIAQPAVSAGEGA